MVAADAVDCRARVEDTSLATVVSMVLTAWGLVGRGGLDGMAAFSSIVSRSSSLGTSNGGDNGSDGCGFESIARGRPLASAGTVEGYDEGDDPARVRCVADGAEATPDSGVGFAGRKGAGELSVPFEELRSPRLGVEWRARGLPRLAELPISSIVAFADVLAASGITIGRGGARRLGIAAGADAVWD